MESEYNAIRYGPNKGFYEEDVDTDEFARRHRTRYRSYSEHRDDDSDWSEDEQLGVEVAVHRDDRKRRKQKKESGPSYDVNVHDMNSMPIRNETTSDEEEEEEEEETEHHGHPRNDAVEVRAGGAAGGDEHDENETFHFEEE